jgi:carboxyl-terminal processing protease
VPATAQEERKPAMLGSTRARFAIATLLVWMAANPCATGAAGTSTDGQDWDGSAAQKVWGLMQVWGTVKYNFAFFDHVPDLDWDAAVHDSIPRVLAAESRDEYHRRLNEVVALLHDGHTFVVSPTLRNGDEDNPPVEFQVVENRIVLVRVGDTEEIEAQGIQTGMELVSVGDAVPAREALRLNALRYYSGSTRQGGEAMGMFLFLRGPKGSTVDLTLADADGAIHHATLTRSCLNSDGTPFQLRILDVPPLLESKTVGHGIAYIRIATFEDEQVVDAANDALDALDLQRLRGMIIDLRYNMGGDDRNAYPIVSRLIERPATGSTWKTREYRPAFASWGEAETWYQGDTVEIEPSFRQRYAGPLVILTGPNTLSTAEDFVVPLDYAGRALLVGEPTAGSTGNPVNVNLPGGAILRVCSKRDTYPDGREFVGHGIEPDIVVHPTVAGLRSHRDEVLEKAIEVLGDWGRYEALAAYGRPR